ncbi:MAG: hypothetical protein KIT31_12620 [Deltaproteobacteria bacterium]|nr:hypothetical protein [Deltaproteobacteria bacterium]
MTTVSSIAARCAVCSEWQQVPAILSTSTSGPADLDGRPAEPRRSTMAHWRMQCGHCGHVAEDLGAPVDPATPTVVKSTSFALERANTNRPPLVNRFVCGAIIEEHAGRLDAAAWMRVYAAWAADDHDGAAADAIRERVLAVALFDRAEPPRPRHPDEHLHRHATRVDLARRAGMFGRAFDLANEGDALIAAATPTSTLQRLGALFDMQRRLVRAGDRARHTWGEVAIAPPVLVDPPLVLPDPPRDVLDVVDLDSVRALPYLPRSLIVGATAWKLVDELALLDPDSEQRHAFAITGASDSYRSRQKLKYPCGTTIEDAGRAHVGGKSTYRILDLTPYRDVLVVRRTDYIYGDYELELFVHDVSAGLQVVAGSDRVHRWRSWPFVIPGALVTSTSVTVEQIARSPDRDVNMFHYWFYQPDD